MAAATKTKKQKQKQKVGKKQPGAVKKKTADAANGASSQHYTIQCKNPVEDKIMKLEDFLKYVIERTASYDVKVEMDKTDITVTTTGEAPFSKRYLKYLTKKYLRRNSLSEWMRVVASSKGAYEIRYYNVDKGNGSASDASDD